MRHTATFTLVTLTAAAIAFLAASVMVAQSPKILTMQLTTSPEVKPAVVEPLPTDESWTRWPTLVY